MKKFFAFIILSFFIYPLAASAATIVVAPSAKSVTAGSQFTVSIAADTDGKYVNAVEATVNYSADLLEVVSISGAKTFSLQTPGSPSRSGNTVFFSGGMPSPGYKGVRGGVGYITFKAKAAGTAHINILSGKVLLNDGQGTDVFDATSNATIFIAPPIKIETPPAVEVPPIIEAPVEMVPEITPTPVVTPVPVVPQTLPASDTIVIKTSDLFLLIYVLVGSIIFLITSVVILSILLLRKSNKEKKD